MRSSTETLAAALATLSHEIYCEDGVATAALAEASRRLIEQLAEIERLRLAIRRLAEQDATLSVCDGAVTVTMDATLTDAEREAVEQAIDAANGMGQAEPWTMRTLRGLLERLG